MTKLSFADCCWEIYTDAETAAKSKKHLKQERDAAMTALGKMDIS